VEQEHYLDSPDRRAEHRSKKAIMRKQKGWRGFVWGYAERCKVFDKVWHKIRWNDDPKESGAKEVIKEGNKIIYKF